MGKKVEVSIGYDWAKKLGRLHQYMTMLGGYSNESLQMAKDNDAKIAVKDLPDTTTIIRGKSMIAVHNTEEWR